MAQPRHTSYHVFHDDGIVVEVDERKEGFQYKYTLEVRDGAIISNPLPHYSLEAVSHDMLAEGVRQQYRVEHEGRTPTSLVPEVKVTFRR